jgi:hypothetical protein
VIHSKRLGLSDELVGAGQGQGLEQRLDLHAAAHEAQLDGTAYTTK